MSETASYFVETLSSIAVAFGLVSGVLFQWTAVIRYRTAALVLVPVGVVAWVVGNYLWGFAEGDESPGSRLGLLGGLLIIVALGLYLVAAGLAAVPGQPPYHITLTAGTVDMLVRLGAWATLTGVTAVVLVALIDIDIEGFQPEAEPPPDDPTEILEDD